MTRSEDGLKRTAHRCERCQHWMKSWENIHPVKVISENKTSEELSPSSFNKKRCS